MGVSLDGYTAGPDGGFDWAMPDEEQHRFHEEQTRALGAHLCGRHLYETMVYWETSDEEFGRIWQQLPKIVFSRTLDAVEGNATLATEPPEQVAARLRAQPGPDIAVGGPSLAASVIDQIDEFHLFVSPVVVGGGTPFFPPGAGRIDLELVETRTFASRVVYCRYARAAGTTGVPDVG